MFIYRLNIFCVLFFLVFFFFVGVWRFYPLSFYAIPSFHQTHTYTNVYQCRKCYLVELLLRLAHKQENEMERKKTFGFTTLTKALHFPKNRRNDSHKNTDRKKKTLHKTIVIVTTGKKIQAKSFCVDLSIPFAFSIFLSIHIYFFGIRSFPPHKTHFARIAFSSTLIELSASGNAMVLLHCESCECICNFLLIILERDVSGYNAVIVLSWIAKWRWDAMWCVGWLWVCVCAWEKREQRPAGKKYIWTNRHISKGKLSNK